MNKKSIKKTGGSNSRKLRLNKETVRDLTPDDKRMSFVRGGSVVLGPPTYRKCG